MKRAGIFEDAANYLSQIKNNVKKGQEDWRKGKIKKYGSINPFKK